MYLSLNWLKEYVSIPGSLSPEELGFKLTMHTVEIDGIEREEDRLASVVVGKILEIKKHPNADRLQLAVVNIGEDKDLEIVCGAFNIKAGRMVPVAIIGAVLPSGAEIREVEVRGVKSQGMLCAEDELGLGDDHAGIMILDKNAKLGQKLGEYLKLKDVIFEVDNKSITNRPDLWGHYGMAREIAAFLNTKLNKKITEFDLEKLTKDAVEKIKVTVEDHKLCPRYMAIALNGIKIEASPKWIQDRLIAVGVRPINNIVDITNYVMLELGQPLHAFNRSSIKEIVVRKAKKDEELVTIDNETRDLNEKMLVIADHKNPIAIAGVMGGTNSEINNETESVIIESANFDFVSIRKTSQALGLRSEASMRFEKGLDPNLCELALARTVEFILEVCPTAKIATKVADISKFKLNKGPIELDGEWVKQIIGADISENEIIRILTHLGFGVVKKDNIYKVSIPSWRATRDISIKEDLVEEIARIYGYDNIEPIMPKVEMMPPPVNEERILERKIKNILSFGTGLSETYNYPFVGEDQLKKLGIDCSDYIRLANPIVEHLIMLRQNLSTNLFNNIKINQARSRNLGFFEIASVFSSIAGELEKGGESKDKLPYQEKRLGIILASEDNKELFDEIKGVIEKLLSHFNLKAEYFATEIIPNWADSVYGTEIKVKNKAIGLINRLDPKIAKKLGLKKTVFVAEITVNDVFLIVKNINFEYEEYEKYPPVIRDLAFVVMEKVLYNDIREEMINFHDFIKKVDLFDVYRGEKIGADKKNIAFHIVYHGDRTLKSEEVDKVQAELIERLEQKFEAKIRDF